MVVRVVSTDAPPLPTLAMTFLSTWVERYRRERSSEATKVSTCAALTPLTARVANDRPRVVASALVVE